MKCEVFDTYVHRDNGDVMHFDIMVPPGTQHDRVYGFGKAYLEAVGVEDGKITAEHCRYCHVEKATPEMEQAIERQGYYILAMEGCPPAASES